MQATIETQSHNPHTKAVSSLQWPRVWVRAVSLCCRSSPLSPNPVIVISQAVQSNKVIKKPPKQRRDAYFPCSAVMYSSHEMVLGAGAVRDCLLAGWAQENISQWHIHSPQGTVIFTNGRRIQNTQFFLSPQSFVHWCSLLYSSSPWWLYSSRCPPHWGVLCAFVTRAPGRSPRRSQPGSFQPSPEQKKKTSDIGGLSRIYPVILRITTDFLNMKPDGWSELTS